MCFSFWLAFNSSAIPMQIKDHCYLKKPIFFSFYIFHIYNRENKRGIANSLSKADQIKQVVLPWEAIILAFYSNEELFSFTLKALIIKYNWTDIKEKKYTHTKLTKNQKTKRKPTQNTKEEHIVAPFTLVPILHSGSIRLFRERQQNYSKRILHFLVIKSFNVTPGTMKQLF